MSLIESVQAWNFHEMCVSGKSLWQEADRNYNRTKGMLEEEG
jgi:hypothetical protein